MQNILESFRIFYITAFSLVVVYTMFYIVLERRHSLKWLCMEAAFRLVVVRICFFTLFKEQVMNSSLLFTIALTVFIADNITNIFLAVYTFAGSVVRNILYLAIIDLSVSAVNGTNIIIANIIGGREDPMALVVPFQSADLLIGVLLMIEFALFLKYCKKFILWAKKYRLKHTRFWSIFVLCYVLAIIFLSPVQQIKASSLKSVGINFIIWMIIGVIILLAICIYVWDSYKKQILYNHQMLKKQETLMLAHVKAVQMQIHKMENARMEAALQVKEILEKESEGHKDKQIDDYMAQLKKNYQEIKAGTYCKDWLVDASLYYMADRYDKAGTEYEFSFQNYDRGSIPAEEIAEVILQILNLQTTGKVSVKAQRIADELFFKVSGIDVNKRKVKKAVSYFLDQHAGELWIDKKEKPFLYVFKVSV